MKQPARCTHSLCASAQHTLERRRSNTRLHLPGSGALAAAPMPAHPTPLQTRNGSYMHKLFMGARKYARILWTPGWGRKASTLPCAGAAGAAGGAFAVRFKIMKARARGGRHTRITRRAHLRAGWGGVLCTHACSMQGAGPAVSMFISGRTRAAAMCHAARAPSLASRSQMREPKRG